MGKTIRRVIAILLCVTALILIFVPSSSASASTQKGDFEIEGSTLVSYKGEASEVTLPNTITAIGKDSFSNNSKLTKVVIPDSVKIIDYAAFENCNNLQYVSVGDGVKSIGSSAFSGCSSLQSVNIPEKCNELGSGVFAGCTSLSNVSIDSQNRVYICLDGVIYTKDGSLLVQYLPGRTSSIYSMPVSVKKIGEYSFWGADSLTNVSVSNGVNEIPEYAFSNCKSLSKVVLPTSVESLMAYSFADCPNLSSVYIPDSVGYIDDKAFYLSNGTIIKFVTPDGNTTKEVAVSDVRDVVDSETDNNDGNSGDVIVSTDPSDTVTPDSNDDTYTPSYSGSSNWVTVINSRDFSDNKVQGELGSGKIVGGEAMFIMSPDMPVRGFDIDDAEYEDSIASSGGNTTNKNDDFNIINGVLASYNGGLEDVSIPQDVKCVGNRAFYKNGVINNVSLPNGVTEIGDFAFSRSSLFGINIPSTVDKIGYAAFYHCENLTDVTIPSSVNQIELGAFDGTAWLNNWKNNDDGNSFLVVGDGVLLAYKGEGGNISIPNGVKTIGAGCFEGNTNITGVTIPDSVICIGEDSFNGCTNLKSVALPEGLYFIEDRAFCDTGIDVISIPDSVLQIGFGAFDTTANMTPLKTVILKGKDVPNVSYKDTATRLSASDLRNDALNGVENVIVPADCNLESGTLFNPVYYGFHGQIYSVSDDSTDEMGTLVLLKTTKKPDESGVVSIDSKVPIGTELYYMNGVKDSAFDEYLDYQKWCDTKPVSVDVVGNSSSDLNNLLKNITSRIEQNSDTKKGITVVLEGTSFDGNNSGFASINDFESKATLVVSENDSNRSALNEGLFNYYGPNVAVNMIPLDISLFDSTGTVLIHKLGDNKLDVSIPLPSKYENSQSVIVASLDDNGSLTELPTGISEKEGIKYLDFVANHCSVYAIYVKNETTIVSNPEENNETIISDDNDPRMGRDEYSEEEIVEISNMPNSDDLNSNGERNIVVRTLTKHVGNVEAKWFIIIILFALAGVLFCYKSKSTHY